MTSPSSSVIAGFHLVEQKQTHDPMIEKWVATRDGVSADLYILPTDMREHIAGLPNIVGFSKVEVIEETEQIVVVIPGQLVTTASKMSESFGPTYSACFAWHISDLLSVLHQSGQAHNWLHPESIGINQRGQLEIRPAFDAFLRRDPDASASAIATDCWQMGYVFERMGVTEKLDNRLALLTNGLRQDLSRLRIQPATAIRQSLSVVLARNSKWEEDFVQQLGPEWALNQRTFREHSIIPHRLESEPKVKIQQSASKSTSDMIDLWGNPFSSTETRDASSSSGQALLREAFASNMTNTFGKMSNQEMALEEEVPEVMLERPPSLEIDLPVDSLQIPIQAPAGHLQSIQEIGLDEDFSLSALMGMRSIVEESDVVDLVPIIEENDVLDDPYIPSTFDSSPLTEEVAEDVAVLTANGSIETTVSIVEEPIDVDLVQESISEVLGEPTENEQIEEAIVLDERPSELEPSDNALSEDIVEESSIDLDINVDVDLFDASQELEVLDEEVVEEVVEVEVSSPPEHEDVEIPLIESIVEDDLMMENDAVVEVDSNVEVESSSFAVEESDALEESEEELTTVFIPEPEFVPEPDVSKVVEVMEDGSEVVEASDGPVMGVFLGGIPLVPIVEEVSEDPEVTGAILDTDTPEPSLVDNPFDYADEQSSDGFVASFDMQQSPTFSGDALDVEEPLAAVEFPSIEEVRSQDASFSGDLDSLFGNSEPVVSPPRTPASHSMVQESPGVEPKWTGSTAFDNLTDSENALGDEKYNMEQVELGDVDAVLSESIRDYSEVEQKGSIWGMLLVATIIVVFGVLYLLNPQKSDETAEPLPENVAVDMTGNVVEMAPVSNTVAIQTNPPQGRVYIDNVEVGVAPVEWESTEGNVFMMCVDWGSNPICRRVSKADLDGKYTFEQVLTP